MVFGGGRAILPVVAAHATFPAAQAKAPSFPIARCHLLDDRDFFRLNSPSVEPLRVYYGPDTRAAGFLVGSMLAILWVPWKASAVSRRGKL